MNKKISKAANGAGEKKGGMDIAEVREFLFTNSDSKYTHEELKNIKRKDLQELLKSYLVTNNIHIKRDEKKTDCVAHLDCTQDNMKYLQLISIDPGSVNFALRIERRWYPGNGYDNKIDTIVYEVVNFKNGSNQSIYSTINLFLDQYVQEYKNTHVVIIERQMSNIKTGAINYKMIRVSQHIISYFITKTGNWPKHPSVIEFDSGLKTNLLGAPLGLDKPGRKKWCRVKALELLTRRNDITAITKFNQSKKKDDLGDIVCQAEAYCILLDYPLTL